MSMDRANGNKFSEGENFKKNRKQFSGTQDEYKKLKDKLIEELKKLKDDKSTDAIFHHNLSKVSNESVNLTHCFMNMLNFQKYIVQCLWHISSQQNNFIKQNEFNKLFDTRYEKEDMLKELKNNENQVRYMYQNWQEINNNLTDNDRNQLQSTISNISKLIEQLLCLEKENRKLLEKRRDELNKELGTVNFYQNCLFSAFENKN